MKNTLGNSVCITLFGESHAQAVGVVVDGLAPGIEIDNDYINRMLLRRKSRGNISTLRHETDEYKIISGVFQNRTTGTPLTLIIENGDIKSDSYTHGEARPGHADYTAFCKYHGYEDYNGGGHFSGRLTAPVVAAGGILLSALEKKGIYIASHIKRCAGVDDREFDDFERDISLIKNSDFPTLCTQSAEKMKSGIIQAAQKGDSVGGIVETVIYGLDAGIGEPWFDTLEGALSHGIFSIPGVKGIQFGKGFALADMTGSLANDGFYYENERVKTATNNNGGINGGISNGMPIVFSTAVKPTPSISVEQSTIDFLKKENIQLEIKGRHDPCIVHRSAAVHEAVSAFVIADMLALRYGTDWLR